MTDLGGQLRHAIAGRGLSLRATARRAGCSPGYLSNVIHGRKPLTPSVAARLDQALGTGDKFAGYALNPPPGGNDIPPQNTSPRHAHGAVSGPRSFRQTAPPGRSRAVEAIQAVIAGDPDGPDIASGSLAELVSHYAGIVSMAPSRSVYDELFAVRSYAGTLLNQGRTRKRAELTVAAGWLSSLLAVSATDLGDHAAAVIWCSDAERRGADAGYPELLGWPALTRAVIAYYQGNAAVSAELASRGQALAPAGSAAHARLAAQEMRCRAMLGDAAGTADARQRAVIAMEELSPGTATAGAFGIARDTDPPYTATSLLMAGRYTEAATVTRRIIETIYRPRARPPGEQPTNYARTLLILALAAAGDGDADEAAAAGRAALECGRIVWPTMVLAARLDRFLGARASGSAHTEDYRARFADARGHLALPALGTDAERGTG